ncbi:hypothetical protein BDW71DRAFT_211691 [Aspergillus fruticulosus]
MHLSTFILTILTIAGPAGAAPALNHELGHGLDLNSMDEVILKCSQDSHCDTGMVCKLANHNTTEGVCMRRMEINCAKEGKACIWDRHCCSGICGGKVFMIDVGHCLPPRHA